LPKVNESNKSNISLGPSDILFTLTLNNSLYKNKENITNLIGKMVIIKDNTKINLSDLSLMLDCMKIDKLCIFSVNPYGTLDNVNSIRVKEPSMVLYTELGEEKFVEALNSPGADFKEYNKFSLYIMRNASYIDVKRLLTKINNCDVNIGRGGSQKAHIVSPLDLRLSCYLMAMFNFDYKLISYLNTFNDLDKDRYLPYIDKSYKSRSIIENKSLNKNLKEIIFNN
jgi:hypothetical protein